MSLKAKILRHALPHIPEQSFTLQPLLHSLSSLPVTHPDYSKSDVTPSVLDVVFGSEVNARRELVGAWEEEGLREMLPTTVASDRERSNSTGPVAPAAGPRPGPGKEIQALATILARRLEYSSRIGEHLVEAQALLSAPSSSPSLPFPRQTLSLISSILPSIPPLYQPPSSSSGPLRTNTSTSTTPNTTGVFSSILESSNDRIPLLRMNPLGPLSYAWKISDKAWYHVERERGLKKGMNAEPVGAGPEWYISRVGLGLVYLASESHLLAPTKEVVGTGAPDIRLQKALMTLDKNLRRYEGIMGSIEGGEQRAGDMVGYLGFIGRAWAGILRSRGW